MSTTSSYIKEVRISRFAPTFLNAGTQMQSLMKLNKQANETIPYIIEEGETHLDSALRTFLQTKESKDKNAGLSLHVSFLNDAPLDICNRIIDEVNTLIAPLNSGALLPMQRNNGEIVNPRVFVLRDKGVELPINLGIAHTNIAKLVEVRKLKPVPVS